jgi:hypothetical protein
MDLSRIEGRDRLVDTIEAVGRIHFDPTLFDDHWIDAMTQVTKIISMIKGNQPIRQRPDWVKEGF